MSDRKTVLEKLRNANVPNWNAKDVEDALIVATEFIDNLGQVNCPVICLTVIDDEHKVKDFNNKLCLILYKNYDVEKWLVANAHHDNCFWFDEGLPMGDDWIYCYGFLGI